LETGRYQAPPDTRAVDLRWMTCLGLAEVSASFCWCTGFAWVDFEDRRL
jgi:hypothetical protein